MQVSKATILMHQPRQRLFVPAGAQAAHHRPKVAPILRHLRVRQLRRLRQMEPDVGHEFQELRRRVRHQFAQRQRALPRA